MAIYSRYYSSKDIFKDGKLENSKYSTVEKFQVIEAEYNLKNKNESIYIPT